MSGKLFIKTSGCQMNEYDSSKMADLLAKTHGLTPTDVIEEADVILLNTCSIREKAEEKVFSDLGRLRPLKVKNPRLIIGVGGCVASQEGKGIIRRAPYVDLVFGPQTIHRLPKMIDELGKGPVIDISFPEIEKFDNLPKPSAKGPTAFVSVIEGCSKYCSFCVVPYTRGEEVSRPFDDILAEVAQLAQQGVREINLLGQNVNAYRGPLHEGGTADLAALIQFIEAIEGIDRIRFTTSHPVEFSPSLIEVYGTVPSLVNHLHLPVQSGSDRILALMKRGHTVLEYKSKLRKIKALRPNIHFSSDFIVGFPGETEKDFEDTMNLIHDIGYDNSFSFIYSPRPGTPAADLPDDTPMEVKKRRLKILQDRIQQNTFDISASMVGSTEILLVEGVSKKHGEENQLQGRTENNRLVHFIGSPEMIGQLIPVKITDTMRYSLKGEI
jgi:tRNA-2-methylthio-N6-dimethylallyladenosine synthase